jgi:hypothetical protein
MALRAHGAASAALCGALAFALIALAAPSAQAACPNEARRSDQGAPGLALPDCRAYELVSPSGLAPLKVQGQNNSEEGFEASLSGDRMAFLSHDAPLSGSRFGGPHYLSTRGQSGWSAREVIPTQSVLQEKWCFPTIGYSPDLSKSVLQDGWGWGEGYPTYYDENGKGTGCGHDEPLLVPGEPLGAQNLFLHDSEDPVEAGFYQLLNLTPPNLAARNTYFQGGSSDFSHLLFTSAAQLTPEAPVPGPTLGGYTVGEDLYEWVDGSLRLVTFLPDGEPVWGLLVNAKQSNGARGSAVWTHALSADGERAFFYAGGEATVEKNGIPTMYAGGSLYLRENAAQEPTASGECSQSEPAKACTLQIDALQGGAGGTDEPHFQWASADGSRAFFTDESKLTESSTATSGKPDLYEYDLGKPEGERLTDLTVHAGEPANVRGLSGVSDDGSYVYFVAEGVLATNEVDNGNGEEAAEPGKPNLYLRHAGLTTFIATLDSNEKFESGDHCDWYSYSNPGGFGRQNCMTALASPDGRFLAFNSLESLTGYDNTVVEPNKPGERDNEIFLYDAAAGELRCVSCDPSGEPPTANLIQGAGLPMPMDDMTSKVPSYLTRSLSDTGRVFFTTANALLSADTNGVSDVYEYEGGNLHLISTGTSPDRSEFKDASANGDDVFFITTQPIASSDTDKGGSLYDARVGGGFPEPPPTVVCESEEACHTAHQQPPASSTSGTSHFEGPEEGPNHPRCPKGQAKRHGKCVGKKHHKRHKRSHGRANHNRGGQR